MLSYLILGLLRQGGPRHGYALMKDYRDTSGRELNVGNFYREFQRLRRDGLIRRASNPADADARRVPYEITDRGVAEFDGWLVRPASNVAVDYENEPSLRAFFVLHGRHPSAEAVLRQWAEELRAQRRTLQLARDEALHASRGAGPGSATLALWLGRRLSHLAVDLEFVESLLAACRDAAADRRVVRCAGGPAGGADAHVPAR
jgi:DNA-binding PadR family transcriptional regulator